VDFDVLIVGGGVSGLYAARLLSERGLRVHLLEAQSRLGGRLHTVESPEGHRIDLGGQWVGPQHTKLLRWCQDHRIPLHATHFQGRHRLITPTRSHAYRGTIPRLSPLALISLGWGLYRLKRAAQHLSPQAPWAIALPKAEQISLGAWRAQVMKHPLAKAIFDIGLSTVLGCEPEEVSLWHTLFYIQSAGSLEALIETETGAQAYKFTEGAASFITSLSRGLSYGLGEPVRRIHRSAGAVSVETSTHTYHAKAVIIAVPPAVLSRIDWEPSLPPVHQQLSQRMPMGSITKVVAVYDRPFWREAGWSGHFLRTYGAIRLGFDVSPPDASYGQVTAFAVGPLARSLLRLSPEERQAFYEQESIQLWGQRPLYLHQKSWADEPWIGGCYAGFFGPGGWTHYGRALHTHLPPIFWAGTERSLHWMGYIEGAMWAAESVVEHLEQVGF